MLIEAEAGGGKTRLVQEFARRTLGARLLVGRCYESTRALPYHPWIELLDAHLETADDTALNDLSPLALDYLHPAGRPGCGRCVRQRRSAPVFAAGARPDRRCSAAGSHHATTGPGIVGDF